MRFHVYPSHGGGEGGPAGDPILYPELCSRRKRSRADEAIRRGLDISQPTLLAVLSPLLLLIAARSS